MTDVKLTAALHSTAQRARSEAANVPPATTRITRYEVSVIPEHNINHQMYAITVEDRGADRWAVCRMGMCLAADGTWSYESRPSGREDDWLDAHRFTLGAALALAEQYAPLITVNGFTVSDLLAAEQPDGTP